MAQLVARGLTLDIDRPLIMAVINATPDSFSDAGKYATLEARMERTQEVVQQGADILDIGGQSAITGVPEISEEEEIERITPVIQWVAANTSAIMSIDTYRPKVAAAALEAGAHIINDISGLLHRELADVVCVLRRRIHPHAQPRQTQRCGSLMRICMKMLLLMFSALWMSAWSG
jgi:dihydropteroate synthase